MTEALGWRYSSDISPVLAQHLLRDRTSDAERFWLTPPGLDRQQVNQLTICVLVSVARVAPR
ncbi:MAG: hypothetical protein HYS05_18185 [Acidobacteria bacterium]|nr:hypothetical protein [Acidobacteriota bacterium]